MDGRTDGWTRDDVDVAPGTASIHCHRIVNDSAILGRLRLGGDKGSFVPSRAPER